MQLCVLSLDDDVGLEDDQDPSKHVAWLKFSWKYIKRKVVLMVLIPL
jgi:hypothetical protein